MGHIQIVFVFILISNALSVNSELTMEGMLGGYLAFPENYKYHVGIIGKHNDTYVRSLACSGGIISPSLILGNAECFFHKADQLMKLRFYVIVKSINLRHDYTRSLEVLFIYSYTDKPLYNQHLLALLQLEVTLDLENDRSLKALTLPKGPATYTIQALVAGYGVKTLEEKKYYSRAARMRVTKTRDVNLTYAYVDIADDVSCKNHYLDLDMAKELCGIIPSRYRNDHRGLCTYDEGAPLVIGEDLVIAVANRHRYDCDDTREGHLYTKLSYYLDFVNGVKNGSHIEGTVKHMNRPFIFKND